MPTREETPTTEAILAAAATGTLAEGPPEGATGAEAAAAGVGGATAGVLGSAALTAAVTAAIRRLARTREQDGIRSWYFRVPRDDYPDVPSEVILDVIDTEVERDGTALERMRERLLNDLPDALADDDPEAAIDALLKRERRYLQMHEDAAWVRTKGALRRDQVRRLSPDGAFWVMSPHVKEHTPDCIALAAVGWWPWSVLDKIWPPNHPGCRCELLTQGEAQARGLLPEGEPPDTSGLEERGDEIIEMFGLLQEAIWGDLAEGVQAESVHQSVGRSVARHLPEVQGFTSDWGGHFSAQSAPGSAAAAGPEEGSTEPDTRGTLVEEMGHEVSRQADLQGNMAIPECPILSTTVPLVLEEVLWNRRFDRGTIWGGRFMPRRGGFAPRISLNDVLRALDGPDARKLTPRGQQASPASVATDAAGVPAAASRAARKAAPRTGPEGVPVQGNPVRQSSPPVSFDAMAADARQGIEALAEEVEGALALGTVGIDPSFRDTQGNRNWNGDVTVGPTAEASIKALAERKANGEIIPSELAAEVYHAYRTTLHEMAHALNPQDPEDYTGSGRALEEALTEEMAHEMATDLLSRHGQYEVLRWNAQNTDHRYQMGTYTVQRQALLGLLDEGNVPLEHRRDLLHRLKFDVNPKEREGILAVIVAGPDKHGPDELGRERRASDIALALNKVGNALQGAETLDAGGQSTSGAPILRAANTVDARRRDRAGAVVRVGGRGDEDYGGIVTDAGTAEDGRWHLEVEVQLPGGDRTWRYPDPDDVEVLQDAPTRKLEGKGVYGEPREGDLVEIEQTNGSKLEGELRTVEPGDGAGSWRAEIMDGDGNTHLARPTSVKSLRKSDKQQATPPDRPPEGRADVDRIIADGQLRFGTDLAPASAQAAERPRAAGATGPTAPQPLQDVEGPLGFDARYYSDPRRSMLNKMRALPAGETLNLADGTEISRSKSKKSYLVRRPDGSQKRYASGQRAANAEMGSILSRHGRPQGGSDQDKGPPPPPDTDPPTGGPLNEVDEAERKLLRTGKIEGGEALFKGESGPQKVTVKGGGQERVAVSKPLSNEDGYDDVREMGAEIVGAAIGVATPKVERRYLSNEETLEHLKAVIDKHGDPGGVIDGDVVEVKGRRGTLDEVDWEAGTAVFWELLADIDDMEPETVDLDDLRMPRIMQTGVLEGEGSTDFAPTAMRSGRQPTEADTWAVHLFDELIDHRDRHDANYLIDADGKTTVIDNDTAFPPREGWGGATRADFGLDGKAIPEEWQDRLRTLREQRPEIDKRLKKLVPKGAHREHHEEFGAGFDSMWKRLDNMLESGQGSPAIGGRDDDKLALGVDVGRGEKATYSVYTRDPEGRITAQKDFFDQPAKKPARMKSRAERRRDGTLFDGGKPASPDLVSDDLTFTQSPTEGISDGAWARTQASPDLNASAAIDDAIDEHVPEHMRGLPDLEALPARAYLKDVAIRYLNDADGQAVMRQLLGLGPDDPVPEDGVPNEHVPEGERMTVPIRSLVPTQGALLTEHLRRWNARAPAPGVAKRGADGELELVDGHHRVAIQALRGEEDAEVIVLPGTLQGNAQASPDVAALNERAAPMYRPPKRVWRTDEADESFKGKALYGKGIYTGMDQEEVAQMTANPHAEIGDPSGEPKWGSVYAVELDPDLKLLQIPNRALDLDDGDKLTGDRLKDAVTAAGYDGIRIEPDPDEKGTFGALNVGGDQLVIYNGEWDGDNRITRTGQASPDLPERTSVTVGARPLEGKPIQVGGDVERAAQLLAEGKRVDLDQPGQVSSLVSKLADTIREAEEGGGEVPIFDLCKVSVKGTNLFCVDTKGVERVKMPQLKGEPLPGSRADLELKKSKKGKVDLADLFREHLEGSGFDIKDDRVPVANLRASQRQLDVQKVINKRADLLGGKKGLKKAAGKKPIEDLDPIFVSKDDYIVDGHHRWATAVSIDIGDNSLGEVDMDVMRVDMDIIELLDEANRFADDWGITPGGMGTQASPSLSPAEVAGIDEARKPDAAEVTDTHLQASPPLRERLADQVRIATDALGFDPFDVDLKTLRSHGRQTEKPDEEITTRSPVGHSPCSAVRSIDFMVHRLLPAMLEDKHPDLAQKLIDTSPRWGRGITPEQHEAGATPLQRGVPTGTPTSPGDARAIPAQASPQISLFGKKKKADIERSLAEAPPAPVSGIPDYTDVKLTDKKGAGGSTGARMAIDADGNPWLVKTYKGDTDRVATELLSNSIYRELGIAVPNAGEGTSKHPKFGESKSLTYPLVDGEERRWTHADEALGEGFVADALLANWDVIGLGQDNVLWNNDDPIRLDQGGTLAFRAQGQRKPYGDVPTELWTMNRPGGQAFGRMAITEDGMRAQARDIELRLIPERIDELVDAAPFEDDEMRDDVRGALKARVDWLGRYSRGEESLPEPTRGEAVGAYFGIRDADLETYPEEDEALAHYVEARGDIDAHLHSGAPKEAASIEVQGTIEQLDALLGDKLTRIDEDIEGWVVLGDDALSPEAISKMVGQSFRERSYLSAEANYAPTPGAVVIRLHVPEGNHALSPAEMVREITPGRFIMPRGTRIQVSGVSEKNGATVVDAVVV